MKNKILIFAVMAVLILGITSAQAFIPGTPINGANTTGCGWQHHTWGANATGNVTDRYNFTLDVDDDGSFIWANISVDYHNVTGYGTHQNVTGFVYAYNSTGNGNLSLTNLSLGNAVCNCPMAIADCTETLGVYYGSTLSFDLGYTDDDADVTTYDGNNTFGAFDTSTGVFSWLVLNSTDVGTYTWSFNLTESNATITGFTPTATSYCNTTVTVIMTSSASRGAPALTPIAILGGLALWSTIIVLASRRKRKEN